MDLRLDVLGRLAIVVGESRAGVEGYAPEAVRRLAASMVADPPAVWPPPFIGTVTRDGDRVAICAAGSALGELACPRDWRTTAAETGVAVFVLRCGDGGRGMAPSGR